MPNDAREALDGLMLKELLDREAATGATQLAALDPREHLDRPDRITAEFEERVADADAREVQHLREDLREQFLDRRVGGDEAGVE